MPRRSFGVDYDRMRERARDLLAIVGLHCRPEDTLKRLRPSEQQLVEIARALSVNAKVLIMDEPTAALSQREVERLFAVVAELKARQVAMMFVSHRMEEIYRVADRIAVLRDGRLIGVQPAAELDRDSGGPDDDRTIARRDLSAAANDAGQRNPGGRGPLSRRGLRRCFLHSSRGRDPWPRRIGGQRTHRDRARAVRHRPAERRLHSARGRRGFLCRSGRGDGCRRRLRFGRPARTKPSHGVFHPRQRVTPRYRKDDAGRPRDEAARTRGSSNRTCAGCA